MSKLMLTSMIGLAIASAGSLTITEPVLAKADAAASDPMYESLPNSVGKALVQVKMIMKIAGQDEGREMEVAGTMIDSEGVVLVSNLIIGGFMTRRGMSAPTLSDVKVLIGDDTEGLKARVIARDSELDLAWIKIEDEKAKGRKFDAVDLSNAPTPKPGDKIYAIEKMGKFFDRATLVSDGRVATIVKKPRQLYVPIGALQSTFGMPIFSADGKILGFIVFQAPSVEEAENLPNGGVEGPMILPTSEVVKATKNAKENPMPAEEAQDESSAPKDDKGTTPDHAAEEPQPKQH